MMTGFQVCLALFFVLPFAACIYEDQVGKMDWRRQFIGRPKLLAYDAAAGSNDSPQSLFVATGQNTVASLNVGNGEINWRLCFETEADSSVDALLLKDKGVSVVRNGGSILENIDPESGALNWESALQRSPCHHVKLLQFDGAICAFVCASVLCFDASGISRFATKLPVFHEILWLDATIDDDSSSLLVAVGGLDKVEVFSVNLDEKSSRSVAAVPLQCTATALTAHHIVCIDAVTKSVFVHHILDGVQVQLAIKAAKDVRLQVVNEKQFCLFGSNVVQCFHEGGSGRLVETFSHSFPASAIAAVHSVHGGRVVSAINAGLVSFTAFSENGTQLSSIQMPIESAELRTAETVHVLRIDGPSLLPSCVLVVTDDATVSLLRANGKPYWTRFESLSAVASAELVDLPLSEEETIIEKEFSVPYSNVFQMFLNRVLNELLLLKSYLLRCLNDLFDFASVLGTYDWLPARQSPSLVRDHFGLHKMLVVTTEYGRVFGMDSKTGEILWTFRIDDTELFGRLFPLFVQRTTATHPYPAQCAVVMKSKRSGNGVLVTFNPITGEIFDNVRLGFAVRHASLAPLVDPAGISGLVLWPEGGKRAYVYPRTADRSQTMKSDGRPVFLVVVDRRRALAESFQLVHALPAEAATSDQVMPWAVSKAFSLKLGAEVGDEIVHFEMKALDAKVHSQGRVLGNRSVLYKYLNPNVGVALIKSPAHGSDDISVFIFDAVSSMILYVTKQKRVLPPYHLLVCENWIVYSFWNEKYRRTEISVIEMYEGEKQLSPAEFSSLLPIQPMIYHQTYIFPQRITAMAVTETEKAITPRFIMLAMPFGGVVEVPKSFLDPRRAVNLTQDLREEGVIPYAPDLPIATDHIINYNRSVLRVHGIHAASSGMESTSLVFVFGLDLFFTRVNPSGTFDMLKDLFDHWLIVAVLLGLSSAAILTKKMARQKDTMNAWR